MAHEEGTSAQAQHIDTSQPTPIAGLVIKGVKKLATVKCRKKGTDTIMLVNKTDYDKKKHGEIITDKLPVRKKKAKKKTSPASEEGGHDAEEASSDEGE